MAMSSYQTAGVNLEAADRAVGQMRSHVTATWTADVVGDFGGFAAGIRIPAGFDDPVLMMSTDGVGTKADVARQADRLDGLGWDLVAMCADDLAAAGARPIAMTDYLAIGKLVPDRVERVVSSVAAACSAAGIALLGGETAEHPGVMEPDELDLAGAVAGVVEAHKIVDGTGVRPGQVVLGIASPNLRSNGFSLIRRAVLSRIGLEHPLTGGPAGDVLLEPSVLYSPAVGRLLGAVSVTAMAHVTGGGIASNLQRVLPANVNAVINVGSWPEPVVFAEVAEIGSIDRDEMFATFNMGVGFIVVLEESAVATAQSALDMPSRVIGNIEEGAGRARLV